MPANRKRHAVTAALDRWRLLGELLDAWRRTELGYSSRTAFAAERLPPTAHGNVNIRMVSDIENSLPARAGTYSVGTLRMLAASYGVSYESMLAILKGGTDTLAPASPAPAAPLAAGLGDAPITDPQRAAVVTRYADRIWQQLLRLAAQGITDPSGAQVFPRSPDDAKAWDGTAGRYDLPERVWLLADLQRRDDRRRGNAGSEANGTLPPGKSRPRIEYTGKFAVSACATANRRI